MPHGLQLDAMATQITPTQAEGLLPFAKQVFTEGLELYRTEDVHMYRQDFGDRIPSEVWRDTKFYISTKGVLRTLQPNDIVMLWNTETQEWDDNDHDA